MLVNSQDMDLQYLIDKGLSPRYLISKNRILTSLAQPGTLEFLHKYFVSEFFFVYSIRT
ncbi:hypothetical protein [Methanosarcina sp. MSH10X1]|uniref:hypothetical protein n=1 Tax=Methanosarcina sp. MSH10X1 TaxID=2507075 RepID=UPI0013E3BAD7|nr:hypothetical protein [Methanosarcina sp. MSH10X1]